MINSMHIQNFKCFKDFEVKDLGRVNLIGGKNNVGKSSLLEAIYLLLGFPQHGLARLPWIRYVDTKEPIDAEIFWGSQFYCKDHSTPINLEWKNSSNQTSNLKITWNDSFNPLENPNFQALINQQNNQRIGANALSKMLLMQYTNLSKKEEKTLELHGSWQEMILNGNYFQPIPMDQLQLGFVNKPHFFVTTKAYYDYANIKTLFERLLEQKKESQLTEFLKKIDDRIESVVPYKNTLMLDVKDKMARVPLHYMGDGIQRAMSFYLAIANSPKGIVLIDEIENGLHYSVLPKLFNELEVAAKNFDCQIFATTHSYECIKAAHEGFKDNPNDLRYIRLNRLEDDIISTTYSTEGFARSIDHEWELR